MTLAAKPKRVAFVPSVGESKNPATHAGRFPGPSHCSELVDPLLFQVRRDLATGPACDI
jgi:hypothetical protein